MKTAGVLSSVLDRARAEPARLAVKDLDRNLSYGELGQGVARVAAGLVARGVQPGDRVALLLPNSVDFVVAALASLWVGAVFVPLAVTDPEARTASILEDCEPRLVVVTDAPADAGGRADRTGTRPVVTLVDLSVGEGSPAPATLERERGAYAIYTSGTTGTPKGVLIAGAAFASAVAATVVALDLGAGTRTLCVSPFHFDGSFATLFPTLASGGAVVIRPRESLLFPRTFLNAVAEEGITYTGFSPSYLRVLLSSPKIDRLAGTALSVVALGGEACSVGDVEALWSAAPQVRVFNRYGPTETTIAVTHVELTREGLARGIVPIGRPHPGVSFHLIDGSGRLIDTPGMVGELYIGGPQLMEGYWGAPELTAEVLRTDVVPGVTVYRTGDLVYRDETGDYVYVDRADRVIKRMGVRISLVELADTLASLDAVAAATCVAYDDGGHLGIAAFAVTEGESSPLELRRAVARALPESMLPDRIEIVDSLPLTSSGKLDERRLLADAGLAPLRPAAAVES